MARRLPIYFVLDVSESMAGEPIEQMEQVIDSILSDLRRNPHALETVWFSQIVFAAKPRTLTPLREIGEFVPNALPIGGGTGIGAMLQHLMKTLDEDVRIDSFSSKSDWKPIVYLMTDGKSTDETHVAVERWVKNYRNKCLLVAISLGSRSDLDLLRRLTDTVIVFLDAAPSSYSVYADWISRSIERSISVVSSPMNENEQPIAPVEPGKIQAAENLDATNSRRLDQEGVHLICRCQKSKKPYLLRYEPRRQPRHDNGGEFSSTQEFSGAVALKESYFELSDTDGQSSQVDVQSLDNPGRCLHCGASHALVYCSDCRKLSCGSPDEPWCCPWCGLAGQLGSLEGEAFTERGLG